MYKIELTADDLLVSIYFDNYLEAKKVDLKEARHRGHRLTGPYSADLDSPHNVQGQKHLHVYFKNNQIFALNADGSAHDKSHGVKIPGKVYKALSDIFPDFSLPDDRIIESFVLKENSGLDKEAEDLLKKMCKYFNQ